MHISYFFFTLVSNVAHTIGFINELKIIFFVIYFFSFQYMAVFNLSWRKVKTQVSNLEGNVNKIFILILGKNLPVDEFCQIKKQSINTGFFFYYKYS